MRYLYNNKYEYNVKTLLRIVITLFSINFMILLEKNFEKDFFETFLQNSIEFLPISHNQQQASF